VVVVGWVVEDSVFEVELCLVDSLAIHFQGDLVAMVLLVLARSYLQQVHTVANSSRIFSFFSASYLILIFLCVLLYLSTNV
jgi:hypothetical protein